MNARAILLVEDRPINVALTRRAFTKSGCTHPLVVARDGLQALELLGLGTDEVPALPALVLLDLNLPMVDGLEVLERVRSNPRTRRLPVVILSSSLDEHDVSAAYRLGANSYLQKPIGFEDFITTVDRLWRYWLELNQSPPDSSLRTKR
jgi:two-component system response regulator